MNDDKARILIVDDEPHNLMILQDILEVLDGDLISASDGKMALAALEPDPDAIDVVVLDRMMPGMDGIQCITHMKANPGMAAIPVIMQTAAATHEDVLSGIAAGAYYYLTKPFEAQMLLSMVRAALADRRRYRTLQEEAARNSGVLRWLNEGQFRIRSLEEADTLAGCLAQVGDNPSMLAVGLSELLWNAIEHGNLGIGYEEKGQLVRAGRWAAEVAERLAQPQHRDKWVQVHVQRNGDDVLISIRDDGSGFDWQPFLELDLQRAFHVNGRGIAMANSLSFDRLEYVGCGNEVVGTVRARPMAEPT